MESNWQIIDDKGVIYSGTQDEMESVWDRLVTPTLTEYLEMHDPIDHDEDRQEYIRLWKEVRSEPVEHKGPLRLIEVHKVFN